ncbi:hypothetical protein N658DRAFT_54925 [Parathielavia hyrcaniae]|uniref:Uncharacterized protein n=1 Tax=Parathielavia hyrcaniae TaxID=113614 RepID=A0AAN6PT23_9PEZI|nr:hypothetical protein N658DRAFT_54925 [Parathielavia hyrcaniae]
MRFFVLASLVTTATAIPCKIVGAGNGLCRSCPCTGCEILAEVPNGATREFACVWRLGQSVDGDNTWVYLPDSNCYVARLRTDCAANLLGGCLSAATQGFLPGSPGGRGVA